MTDHFYQQLREHLAYLKLGTVAEQLAQVLEHAESQKPSYTRFLADLLSVEITATEQRRLDGRLRFASFPQHKTLEQFATTLNRHWTAGWSRSSRRCGSSRRRPTCC
jgi:DNA replication protein DnaC